jgi:hypothetical protein
MKNYDKLWINCPNKTWTIMTNYAHEKIIFLKKTKACHSIKGVVHLQKE